MSCACFLSWKQVGGEGKEQRPAAKMAGENSEDIELLLSPKDIQRGHRRRLGRRNVGGYQSEGGAAAATTERLNASSHSANEDVFDDHHYLSDHGLPSERARIAASNRYRELQRSGEQEELANTERTPLLGSQIRETVLGASLEPGTPVLVRVTDEKKLPDEAAHESLMSQKSDLTRSIVGGNIWEERKKLKREK